MEDNKQYKDKDFIIGDAIRIGRKSMLKSQKEFARMIGIGHRQLGELERGNAFPSVVTLAKLRNILGISIDKLIDEINNEIKNETDAKSSNARWDTVHVPISQTLETRD